MEMRERTHFRISTSMNTIMHKKSELGVLYVNEAISTTRTKRNEKIYETVVYK